MRFGDWFWREDKFNFEFLVTLKFCIEKSRQIKSDIKMANFFGGNYHPFLPPFFIFCIRVIIRCNAIAVTLATL